jgi:hypothetical protein
MPDPEPKSGFPDSMLQTFASMAAADALLPRDFKELPPPAFAAVLAEAVRSLTRSGYEAADFFSSPMARLLGHFSTRRETEPHIALRTGAAPALCEFIQAVADGKTRAFVDDVFGALERLIWIEFPDIVPFTAALARRPYKPEHGGWGRVFTLLDSQSALYAPMIEALADPFPPGQIATSLLGPANDACRRRLLARHPFNCAPGAERLKEWLSNHDDHGLTKAWQSAIALQWLDPDRRIRLIELASAHPHHEVKVELAGTLAALGDPAGYDLLIALCKEPSLAGIALERLSALGAADRIPTACSAPDFQAMLEMADWLSSPMEYGRLPSKVSVRARRTMFWPPTQDIREMFLIEYVYPDSTPPIGVGCVGSRTLAFLGDELMNRPDDELFALYCISEFREEWDDSNEEAIQAVIRRGKAMIAEHNAD